MSALYIVTNNERTRDTDRSKARAELKQLRADLASAQERITAQSAQLEQARKLIDAVWNMADDGTSVIDIDPSSPLWQIEADTRFWLAANPEQARTIVDACADGM